MSSTSELTRAETPASPEATLNQPALLAVFRVGIAILWIENTGWKRPPDFSSLHAFTADAVTHPVFAPYSSLVQHLVLPHFTAFAWAVLFIESSIGAFLAIGLATRFWAVVGFVQGGAIMLSAMNAPGEWEWSYYLILLAQIALFATAAGRSYGLDGLLRPRWMRSNGRVAAWLVKFS